MSKDKNFEGEDETFIPRDKSNENTIINQDNESNLATKQPSGYEKTIDESFGDSGETKPKSGKAKTGYEKTIDSEFGSEVVDSNYFGKSTSGQKITFENLAFISNEERYEVKKMLGKGGMGVVMLVRDNILEREVAMKLIKSGSGKTSSYYRFIQEARITGVLEHPNIIPVYDLSCLDDLYFTMRLVDGVTFTDIIQGVKENLPDYEEYSIVKRLQIMLNVCYAMEFAHSKDIIHRDLKPDNIMIGKFGQVLVLDWGLAKYIGEKEETGDDTSNISPDATGSGSLVGTPRYMSPEQAQGKIENIDKFTDVYALGAILYEVIVLEPVFKASDLISLIDMIVNSPVEKKRYNSRGEIIPKELMAIAIKALAKEKHDRYLSVTNLRRDIELYLEGRSVKAAPDNWFGKIEKLVVRNLAVSIVLFITTIMLGIFYHFFSINRSVAEVENKLFLNNLATQTETNFYSYQKTLEKKHEYLQQLRKNLTQAETSQLQIELAKIEKEAEFYGQATLSASENILRIEKNENIADILASYYVLHAEDILRSQNYDLFDLARLEVDRALTLSNSVVNDVRKIAPQLIKEGSIEIKKLCPQNLELYRVQDDFSAIKVQDITKSQQITLTLGSYFLRNLEKNTTFPFVIQPNKNTQIAVFNTKNVPTNCVFIPEGSFILGTNSFIDEYQKKINVKAFYIETTEVTIGEYLKFYNAIKEQKHVPKVLIASEYETLWDKNQNLKFGLTANCPVFGITIYSAQAYCKWKESISGIPYALPLENEWEKVARGIDGRLFPWGNKAVSSWANVQQDKSFSRILEVGSFAEDMSIYGVKDMAGNVAEWTETQSEEGIFIVKGAHCNDNITNAKAHLTNAISGDYRGYIGFRCVVRDFVLDTKK